MRAIRELRNSLLAVWDSGISCQSQCLGEKKEKREKNKRGRIPLLKPAMADISNLQGRSEYH